MKKVLFSIYLISICTFVLAEKVDTLTVYSNAMKKNIKACVVTPNNYSKTGKPYPVLYLLMGYGGNYSSLLKFLPDLKRLSDLYNMILVCPDCGFSSWYFDSPIDSTVKYETHITKELVKFIDNSFNTIQNRNGRAISGGSMGGHGALYLSFRHQDIFGAAGSISGGVDFRPFPLKWDIAKNLGEMAKYPENWDKNTVTNLLYLVGNNNLAIIIDCGTDDFLYP